MISMACFLRIISFSMLLPFVALAGEAALPATSSEFVQARNSRFVLNGSPFFFNGFQYSYWVMNAEAVPSQRIQVSDFFQQAAAAGFSVCRTPAFKGAGRQQALHISSPVNAEHIFQGLDFVVSESRNNGVRLILSLGNINNYKDFGARPRGATNPGEDLFYTDEAVKGYFKKHVKRVLTRINTITGVAYKDDSTIMAWELIISEPPRQVGETLNGWVQEMANFVKSIDARHLLAVGMEGFNGDPNMPQEKTMHPAGYQVAIEFVRYHLFKEFDFTIMPANMHQRQRRHLHEVLSSPSVVAASQVAVVPPSEPSGCTHIPTHKDGHC